MLGVYVSTCCQHWPHFVGTVALVHMVMKHTPAGPTQNKQRDLIILSKDPRCQLATATTDHCESGRHY
jgi:hypothetical protein